MPLAFAMLTRWYRQTVVGPETIHLGGDLPIWRLGFGTVRLTGPDVWGPPPDPPLSRALLRHVVDSGVNFIDTADSYGPHVVEELIAEALHPYPDGLVIATKSGIKPSGPGHFERDGRPDRLKSCCEDSLRRLRVERIDLYQLHGPDPTVAIEESVGALADLRQAGLVRHIGLSNVSVDELHRAQTVAGIVSVQNCYNVVDRRHDQLLAECERQGIAFLPWFPLARGALARPGGVLARIAADKGVTEAQIALAWLLHRSEAMVPIPGTNNREHFEANLAATHLELSSDDMSALDVIDEQTEPLTSDPSQ